MYKMERIELIAINLALVQHFVFKVLYIHYVLSSLQQSCKVGQYYYFPSAQRVDGGLTMR